MKTRCKVQQLVMSSAVPFGQKWTYHASDPMEDMMKPGYYASYEHMLRTGDEVRIIQLYDGEVACYADVLVCKNNPLTFEVITPPKKIGVKRGRKPKEVENVERS